MYALCLSLDVHIATPSYSPFVFTINRIFYYLDVQNRRASIYIHIFAKYGAVSGTVKRVKMSSSPVDKLYYDKLLILLYNIYVWFNNFRTPRRHSAVSSLYILTFQIRRSVGIYKVNILYINHILNYFILLVFILL